MLDQWTWYALWNGWNWYAYRIEKRKSIYMHRVLMNVLPGIPIDHKNRNGLDNRRENLRITTPSSNSANCKIQRKNNTSGAKGVRFEADRQKWLARITVNGVIKNLGRFALKSDAMIAYATAAKKHFGKFANSQE